MAQFEGFASSISRLVFPVAVILIAMGTQANGDNLVVQTTKGLVHGLLKGQSIRYMGIPYATADRFQYPNTNVAPWSRVRNHTVPGPMCYQLCPNHQSELYCLPKMSENCLTLNVFRPAHNPENSNLFPVVVYLHGGDFSTGSGAAPIYDGDYFSKHGHVVLVTVNYRLGAFGFLSIFDKYGDAIGNFGLRDQQAALLWVNQNIAAFHGDPNKVTLMGDGSGCLSAVSHLAWSDSRPLFHAVILQSCPLNIPYRATGEAHLQAETFSKILNCHVNDVTCYRSKPASEILRAQLAIGADSYSHNMLMSFYPWGPSIDNNAVAYHPKDVFAELTRFDAKPVVIGTTADEGAEFVYKKFPLPLSEEYFKAIVGSVTEPQAYVTPINGDMRESLVRFITEFVFACPARYAARQIETKQKLSSSTPPSKVWLYEFTTPKSLPLTLTQQQLQLTTRALWASGSQGQQLSICDRRSCHGSDVRVLFNSPALPMLERLKNDALARQLVRYWSKFARLHSVNGAITSRGHLRTLQLQTALLPRHRPRAQRMSIHSLTPLTSAAGRQLVASHRTALQAALASFTFWPAYSTDQGRVDESDSTMLLQAPPLAVRRFHWQNQCKA